MKGGSFLKRGFTHKGSKDEPMGINGTGAEPDAAMGTPQATPSRAMPVLEGTSPAPGSPSPMGTPHSRQKSYNSAAAATPGAAETGTATLSVVSATGYPPSANVRVEVKMLGSKGGRSLHKTKDVKSPSGSIVVRSSFAPSVEGYAESLRPSMGGRDSPDSKREQRRSFFGRRDISREVSGKQET